MTVHGKLWHYIQNSLECVGRGRTRPFSEGSIPSLQQGNQWPTHVIIIRVMINHVLDLTVTFVIVQYMTMMLVSRLVENQNGW